MANIIAQILEMDLHALEAAEQDLLLALLRAGKSLITRKHRQKETGTLMARIYATDNQQITEVFSQADSLAVPVDGAASPVSVAVVDESGTDLSKWINVAQDQANPLQFVYTRKTDDGTQPPVLDFTSIGTGTVNGAPAEFKADLGFTPGAATSLTSTITVGAAAPASTDGAATGAASADGTGTGGTVPVEQQQGGQQAP